MFYIASWDASRARQSVEALAELLADAVESGASIGFMPPIPESEARAYWETVREAIEIGSRVLLVAIEDTRVQGAVQLALETRANGNHRAEVMKLFVHRRARRRGIARALMAEAEKVAAAMGRTLLVLDTRKGGEAEKLCDSMEYVKFGEVPNYARSSNGALHTTVFFYKELAPGRR